MSRRHPMLDIEFTFQSERTKKVYEWHTCANIVSQAELEAKDWLERTTGETMKLIDAKTAVAERTSRVLR